MKVFLMLTFLLSSSVFAGLKNETEVSLIKTGGNSDTETYGLKSKGEYNFGKHVIALAGYYNFSQTDSITSKENWSLGAKYDQVFLEKLGVYLGEVVEGDRFKGISRRYNTDLGLSYVFIKNDKSNFKAETGYRYTIDKNTLGIKENYSKLRLFAEYDRQLTSTLKFKYWFEFLPNISESEAYSLSMEPSAEVVLAKELFFKVSYEWKYENLPLAGKAKADYAIKTSLLATF